MTISRLIRFTAMLLIPVLLSNNLAFAARKPTDPAAMKAKLQARGVGQGVRVVLADNTEAKGTIVTIGEQSFTLKSKKDPQPREIEYTQVTGVHNDKITRGQKVAIGVCVAGAVIAVVAIVWTIRFENGFKNFKL